MHWNGTVVIEKSRECPSWMRRKETEKKKEKEKKKKKEKVKYQITFRVVVTRPSHNMSPRGAGVCTTATLRRVDTAMVVVIAKAKAMKKKMMTTMMTMMKKMTMMMIMRTMRKTV